MKEVFSMWKSPKMLLLALACASLYAALLIPFRGTVLIPGISEFRPASALPVVMGLLFGPAGAWGSAVGSLLADFFDYLGISSLFGFVGNFMFAYVPYKLWINLGLVSMGYSEPDLVTRRKMAAYVVVALLGALACALVVAWGAELMGRAPFAARGSVAVMNNLIPALVLGIPLLHVFYPFFRKWNILWTAIMPEKEIPVAGAMSKRGAFFMTFSIIGGLSGGFVAALAAGQSFLYKGFGAGGDVGSLGVIIVAGIGTAGLILSSFVQTMPGDK